MDKNTGALNNNNPLDDSIDENDHTSNYIEAMYKLMSYSLERNERRDGHILRRVGAVSFGDSTIASTNELWAQQLGATRYNLMPSPPLAPMRAKMEKRHIKGAVKKQRETLWNETQKELLDEASVDEDNIIDPNEYQVLKCKQYRRFINAEHKTLPPKKAENVVREPEVIFYDSTAEKGTQTQAM